MRPRVSFFISFIFLVLVGKVACFEVNCGGPGIKAIVPDSPAFYGKTKGSVYQYADGDFNNDKYRTFAYAAGGQDLVYSFNVFPGTVVNVTAEFSEIWSGAWFSIPRVMRLLIGGQILKHHLNVYRDAGNTTNPLSFSRSFVATEGVVEIRMQAITGNAFISALDIQVVHAASPSPSANSAPTTKVNTNTATPTTKLTSAYNYLRVNCGGPALTQGPYLKDNFAFYANSPGYVGEYSQGDTHSNVYTSQSYGDKGSDLVYAFLVTKGTLVTVVARFAEIYAPAKPGDRLLRIYFNNVVQMDNVDVITAAKGLNKHFDVSRTFVANKGHVEVRVKAIKQNAMISGIDIKATGLIRGAGKTKSSGGNNDDDDEDDDDEDDKDDKKKSSRTPNPNTNTGNTKKEPKTSKPTGNLQPPSSSRDIKSHVPPKTNQMIPAVITSYAEINCGGPAIGTNIYADDMKYYEKSPGKIGMFIMGDAAASVYNSQSFGIGGSEIVYSMYVPVGSRVRVVTKFMEIWSGAASPGFRVMSLSIGGVVRAKDLDVFTRAKGLRKELTLERVYTTNTTEIQVRVKSVRQNAMISGISVQILPKLIAVNCGGPAIGTILADGKKFYGKSPGTVSRFMMGDPYKTIYNSQAFGVNGTDLVYTIPVPGKSKVRVTAQFMEIWRGASSKGFRLMQLEIGGHVVARNMDVFTWAVGIRQKLEQVRVYTVTGSEVEVRVKSIRQNAMISGIVVEVLQSESEGVPNTDATTNKNTGSPGTNNGTGGGSGGNKKNGTGGGGGGGDNKQKSTGGGSEKVDVIPVPAPAPPPIPLVVVRNKLEINCGGPAIGNIVADAKRFNFRSPNGVGTFSTITENFNLKKENIYQSQSYGLKGMPLVYAVSVPIGSKVKVVAKFAEIWESAAKQGFRVIDVYIGGVAMAKNLDVWSAAGGIRIPYDLQRTYLVEGKPEVEVRILSVKENAIISGLSIEVLPTAEDVVPTPKEPVKPAVITKSLNLNCGGPAIAAKNLIADEDRFHLKSVDNLGTYHGTNSAISEYGSQAFGKNKTDLVYTLLVPTNSKVKVIAKFAEIWRGANRADFRKIQVLIAGVLMADNLDVWTAAGGLNKEYDVQRTFLALNPEVEIRIKSIKENAMISGLFVEVFEFHAVPVNNEVVAIPVEGTKNSKPAEFIF